MRRKAAAHTGMQVPGPLTSNCKQYDTQTSVHTVNYQLETILFINEYIDLFENIMQELQ